MEKKQTKIAIIGAGISGLIAAIHLEQKGYAPVIYEATDRVGGRVKTDIVNGYQLDHGFQVLLDAYPMAKKYLDYDALHLQKFLPGAQVFNKGKNTILGDPLRSGSLLFPTVFSSIGSFSDKLKVFKLSLSLKKKSVDTIFSEPETTTLEYLKSLGFSEAIISTFFKPFFAGIFLEPDLKTSSRMFQFVYKMFSSGYAVLPKSGIGAIPEQLKLQLKQTKIQFNKTVKSVTDGNIVFTDGKTDHPDYTIIASEASSLVPNLRKQKQQWHSSETLYFTFKNRKSTQPFIGLISDKDALINNIFIHTTLAVASKGDQELLSVTIVKDHNLSESELIQKVKENLLEFTGIKTASFLARYPIKKALPILSNIQYSLMPSETRLTEQTFLAGDYLVNASLNAAMSSGEMAAQGVVEAIEKG